MKTSELSGYLLDYWTGRALGKNVKIIKHQREDSYFCVAESGSVKIINPESVRITYSVWNPSTNWNIIGPLIDDKKIDTTYGLHTPSLPVELDIWVAMKDGVKYEAVGPNPLIAVCRLIVWMEYGDEVPDELAE